MRYTFWARFIVSVPFFVWSASFTGENPTVKERAYSVGNCTLVNTRVFARGVLLHALHLFHLLQRVRVKQQTM